MPKTVHYDYTPSPGPQTTAHHTFVDELLYGGAAGGGKSRMSRAEAVLNCLRVPGFRAIIFRRTFPDLERSVVEPLLQEIPRELGRYNSTKHLFRFFNGSILELGHLQRRDDLMKYQGAEYQLCVERSTPVLMGDGVTWKQIQHMQVGDYVATLEGPKRVSKVHDVGMKPAARVTTAHGSAIVSTAHKLLTADGWAAPAALIPTRYRGAAGSDASLSESCQCGSKLRECSHSGQQPADAQARPHLRGTARQATHAYRAGQGSYSESSDDSPLATEPLLQWSGQLVLYGQPHDYATSPRGLSRDAEYGQTRSTVQGSTDDCPACSRSCGVHDPRPASECARSCPHTPAGAAACSPLCSRSDGPASTPRYNRGGKLVYAHPYNSGQVVTSTADAHHDAGHMAPAGAAYMFDLTVDGANHYVSSGQIIMQNCVFEEATHFVYEMFDYMRSRLRAGGPVAEKMAELGLRPRMILTANPGGVGHHWVKREFIDPAPAGKVWRPRPSATEPNPPTRCYVPAKATDNPYLDKGYINRLNSMSDNLRRALRDGDWDVLDGVRFPDFSRNIHVIEPGQLPIPHVGYPRVIGVDYGSSAPFSAHWMALLPDNLVVVYRELYMKGLTPREQALAIRDAEAPDERMPGRPLPIVLDPSMWARSVNNPLAVASGDVPPPGSIAHAYYEVFGSAVSKARNDRIGGWALLEDQMRVREDGLPRFLIHSTCVNLIRTLPAAPRDLRNPDDIDTKSDDHALDSTRYGLMDLIGKPPAHKFDAQQWANNRRASTVTGDLASARL